MFETEEQKERIILVAVATADGDDTEQSLDELEELGQTAGAVTVANYPVWVEELVREVPVSRNWRWIGV